MRLFKELFVEGLKKNKCLPEACLDKMFLKQSRPSNLILFIGVLLFNSVQGRSAASSCVSPDTLDINIPSWSHLAMNLFQKTLPVGPLSTHCTNSTLGTLGKFCILGSLCLAALLSACNLQKFAHKEPASAVLNLPYHARLDPHWIYNGPLPSLEDAHMVASLRANTLRVTGLLPQNFNASLPYYAIPENLGNRTRITVVYPIATGDTASNNINGRPVRNGPGHYDGIAAFPYNEFGAGGGTPPIEWGGFPFLMYNSERALAFHGPISYDGDKWLLLRGPVSHGCNRMQGEHVVELAHLLGVDMERTYESGDQVDLDVSVDLIDGYDTYKGQYVDVDYPALDEVQLPPEEESRIFPTWRAEDFPRFACEYLPGRALNNSHCNYKPAARLNIYTGTDASPAEIQCPQGYLLTRVGTQGGSYCTDGKNVWGPFTESMVKKCQNWGGGKGCRSNRWAQPLALDARGTGLCPSGAAFDRVTGYCAEGLNVFGPFPTDLVVACLDAGGGGTACTSARWNRNFLLGLLGQ